MSNFLKLVYGGQAASLNIVEKRPTDTTFPASICRFNSLLQTKIFDFLHKKVFIHEETHL